MSENHQDPTSCTIVAIEAIVCSLAEQSKQPAVPASLRRNQGILNQHKVCSHGLENPHGPTPASFSVCLPGSRSANRQTFKFIIIQGSCSADQHETSSTLDPEAGLTCSPANSTSMCSSLDIDLVFTINMATCNCRRNMRWNPVPKECQVWKAPSQLVYSHLLVTFTLGPVTFCVPPALVHSTSLIES